MIWQTYYAECAEKKYTIHILRPATSPFFAVITELTCDTNFGIQKTKFFFLNPDRPTHIFLGMLQETNIFFGL
jgi:hypothetical protein